MLNVLPPKRSSKTYPKGFTLIELLVVTAIITLLVVIALARFTTFGRQINIDLASQQLISALQLARNQTVASEDETVYGVHFEANKYVLFKGSDYVTSTDTKEFNLDKAEIYEINLLPAGSSNVVFTRIRGSTQNTGNIRVRLIAEPSRTKNILINSLGQVSLEEAVSPTGTRIGDTRHVHLDFGWSMQSSTTMSLIFSDPGNPDVIQNINISDYIAGGKFDWEGTVGVYGEDQTLRIHSHLLNVSNTILSGHRDRRYNTKALEIRVDGVTVVIYDAAGNVTAGSINQLTVQ